MFENKLPNQPIDPELQRRLKNLRNVPARDPQMVARSEARFVEQVDELLHEKGFSTANSQAFSSANSPASRKPGIIPYIQQLKEKWIMATPKLRMAMTLTAVFATLFVFMFGGAGMTAYANQNALPGDTLYGIKTGFEQTRLTLARDAAGKARLNLAFAERRLDEIARLIESERYTDIGLAVQEYEGYVQSAIASLETVGAGDPASLAELAALVADSLKRYAATLSGMTTALPEGARSELKRAIDVSFSAGGFRDEIEFRGIVEQISPETWVVAGRALLLIPGSEIKGQIAVGDRVKVHAFQDADGNWILREVELTVSDDMEDDMDDDLGDDSDDFEFSGTVEQITAEAWVIAGRTLLLSSASEIKGNIAIGEQVKVEAWQDASGTWFLDEVERFDDAMDDDMDDDSNDDMDDDSNDDMDDDGSDDDGSDDDSSDDSSDDDGSDDDSSDDDSSDDDSSDDDSSDDDSSDDDSSDDD
jgi:hypothetical protein